MGHDEKVAIGKMGIGIGVVTVAGLSLQDWLFIVSIIYFVAQTLLLIPKFREMWRNWRNPPRNRRRSDSAGA